MTQVVVSSGSTWTVPADCIAATVELIGAGQGGNATNGGNGGDYAKKAIASLTPGAAINIQLGVHGAGVASGSQNAGTDTWFSSAATVLAKGGGSASTSIGDATFAGGLGDASGGGGGAAGPNAAGGAASGSSGGQGDGTAGGLGGASGSAGAAGTEWTTAGSGGGGGAAGATFAQGVDFRNSSTYVTDPANDDYYIGTAAYPVAASSGQSIGWVSTSGIGRRDRSTTVDPRLAGVNFLSALGSTQTFRMSLPAAGTYALTLALGDQSSQIRGTAQIYDGATLLGTITAATTANGHFVDAAGTEFASAAAWVTGQVPVNFTFAGTTLNVVLTAPSSGGVSEMGIAHIRVSK